MSDSHQTIRIFISSPGDVAEEREGARRVVEGLQRVYPGVTLQPVLWEELALPVTASFQETIDFLLKRKPIDIAVFILWSRLGSPLGASITRPDGTPYRSGTEREFDVMLTAFERSGRKRPVILAYSRKDAEGFARKLGSSPDAELRELIDQQDSVKAFITEQFHDSEGRNVRAYQTYREPVAFVQRLRLHLRNAIDELLGADHAATWTEEPYRGLEVFDVHHAPIFHGRDEETCELLQRRRDQEQAGCAFVVVVGASGSGKSSLVRAGVAASLIQNAGDDGLTREWRVSTFVPALATHGICGALVRSIAETLPELSDSESTLDDVSESLAENAALTVRLSLSPAFARASEQAGGKVRWLLILDQMEELWTDQQTTPEDRERFLSAMEALARSGHVSVLATIRSDFYHHAQQSPTFLRMKGTYGQYDLLPPDAASVHRLITEPARLAGVKFERQEKSGRSLDEAILEDAGRDSNALPLLEYALAELYQQRDESRRLMTYAAYVELGGVEGALAKRANETFESLPADAQAAIDEILPLLVTVDLAGEQSAVRRRASVAELTSTPARKTLTDRLTANRFLTTDRQDETPVASLAHEALLRRWDRLVRWIDANREHLRLRARVEQLQQRWEQQEGDESLLLAEGLPLDEGRQLLDEADYLLSQSTEKFIRTSIDHHQQRAVQSRRRKQVVLVGFITLLAIITVGAWVTRRQRQREVTESLVTAVTTARGVAFPPTVDDLDDLPRSMVLDELGSRFEDAEAGDKLPLAFALARFGDVRLEFLVSQIADANPDEVKNFVDALQDDKQEALVAILQAAQSREDSTDAIRRKARLAILSFYLGEPSLASDMCQTRADPIERTVFIDECSSWCGDLIQLKERASQIDDATLRSALCLVVGSISPNRVTAKQRNAGQSFLSDSLRNQPDNGTHSASGWALRLPLPELTTGESALHGERQWRVNNTGLTMLRIRPGKVSNDDGDPVRVAEDFLLSDREISVGLFQRFMEDPDYPASEKPKDWGGVATHVSPTKKYPVQRVSWFDAVMFCNWLSQREELQPCYERTGEKWKDAQGKETEYDDWRLAPSAHGYRLPTGAEWEYACRAGSTTTYSFGDDVKWLDVYGVYRADSAEACGSKLPNAWGLFDMHGNVAEWCDDTEGGSYRVYRGGCWYDTAGSCGSSVRSRYPPMNRSSFGFRVAVGSFSQGKQEQESGSRQADRAEAEP